MSTETKVAHTPGPWAFEDNTQRGRSAAIVAAADRNANGRFYVASTYGPDAVENARLIAAAPELLEAGRKMRAVVSRLALSVVMGAQIGNDIEAAVNEAQDAMNAAIQKAEGR